MPKQVLLVDDDALMRHILALGLEQAGYKASNAANAEEALSLARLNPPDLVLLDINMFSSLRNRFVLSHIILATGGDHPPAISYLGELAARPGPAGAIVHQPE